MKYLTLFLTLSLTSLHAAPLTLFTHGRIVTVDGRFAITDAMAVAGERIVALGDQATALADTQPETQRVHLQGRTVLPGLMDSHAHPVGAATYEFAHPVTRLKEQRDPTREELDRVAPKHPVQFSTGPDSMLNSLALRLASIDRHFQVPAGSTGVVVDTQGEPTGSSSPTTPLLDAGVPVGGGSDHMQKIGSLRAINPYNPWLGMWTAISRRCRDLDPPLHKESGLTREEAIRLYTINNAQVLFLEKECGSREPGKRADFIILDRDLLQCPEEDIKDSQVLETWLDGKRVWKSEPPK